MSNEIKDKNEAVEKLEQEFVFLKKRIFSLQNDSEKRGERMKGKYQYLEEEMAEVKRYLEGQKTSELDNLNQMKTILQDKIQDD